MSNQGKHGTVKNADIVVNLFVRKALDEDRVLMFAGLLELGQKLPRIKVTRDLRLIDGRHRLEAGTYVSQEEVEVEFVDIDSEVDIIAEGYVANTGGSLPPTTQDTEHTIMLLLQRRVSKKRIGELLSLPAEVARDYISRVQSRAERAQLMRAVTAVAEGELTVSKAAETHSVDPEKLRDALSGHKRERRKGDTQKRVSSSFRVCGSNIGKLLKSALDKFEDGDLSSKQVEQIFGQIEKLQRKQARLLGSWRSRYNAMNAQQTEK